jgi:2-iminobutanoate/2-iminopropanoate deaminase
MRYIHLYLLSLLLALSNLAWAQKSANVEFLNSGTVVPATLPFSEAVKVNDTLYLSGQLGNIPGSLKLAPGGMPAEARQAMNNIKAVLQAHGYAMSDLVKCTVMLADIAEWGTFNDIYKTYFDKQFPARSAFAASGLALGARVEVDCIAAH